jgi:putative nucleotidyltransferase with HDIG domain
MWTLTKNKTWESLSSTFSWVADMSGVPQDAIHHAEGDVSIHTQMVLRELTTLPEYVQLSEQDREILWTAALLHDVEKRSTTIIGPDGRVSSPNHAKKGMYSARGILYREVPTDFFLREQIAKLVRYHGLPIWLFGKPDPHRAAIEASLQINLRWLAMLANADMLGRICADQADMLYRVDCFREICMELECYDKPRAFQTDTARITYFNKKDSPIEYIPFEEPEYTVVLMVGLPGSGKDTFVRKHYPDWPVVSLDSLRVEMDVSYGDSTGSGHVIQAAKEKAKKYLRKKQSFVWNATNITRQMREQLIDLFFTYKARVRIEYIEVPYRVLMQQNKNREAVVPSAAIERMIDRLDIPILTEGHEVNYRIRQ